jgi:hypothetical protein
VGGWSWTTFLKRERGKTARKRLFFMGLTKKKERRKNKKIKK